MNNLEVKKLIREKIYPKYENLIGEIHESRRDIPIWLKHCDKETAEELRNLCGSYSQLSESEREQQFPYFFWLPRSQENYTEKPQECKNFGKDFQEFLSELESIVIGKEHDDQERERERESKICSKCGKDPKLLVADDIWISTIQNGKCLSCRSLEEAFKRDQENTCSHCGQRVGKKNLNQKKVCWGCKRLENRKCAVCGKDNVAWFHARLHENKCLSCYGKEQGWGVNAPTIHKSIYRNIYGYPIMGQNTPMGHATVPGTNSGAGTPKNWQCSQCKVKKTWIYIPDFNDKQTVEQKLSSKHKCLTCPKCNKFSSYEDLAMHENFECSANPLNQSQVNQNNQLLTNIRQSLQTTIRDIKNDPDLTSQQKNDLVNNLSPAVSNLQKLLDDLEQKQKKISDSGGDSKGKPTNWTPWIIGGIVVITLIIIGFLLIFRRKKID